MRPGDKELWTQPARAAEAHRGVDAERFGLVARREDDSGADGHGAAAELGVVPLLDRGEEGVDVGVEDRRLTSHEHMFAKTAGSVHAPMAYDEELANRIREQVAGESGLTEQKMFGGLAFLIGGNMAIAASGQGGLLVRADPEESDRIVAESGATLMEMRGKQMRGWLRVDAEAVQTKRELAKWVELGTGYARSLPAKR